MARCWSRNVTGHDPIPLAAAASIMFWATRPMSKSLPAGSWTSAMASAARVSGLPGMPARARHAMSSDSLMTTNAHAWRFLALPVHRPASKIAMMSSWDIALVWNRRTARNPNMWR